MRRQRLANALHALVISAPQPSLRRFEERVMQAMLCDVRLNVGWRWFLIAYLDSYLDASGIRPLP